MAKSLRRWPIVTETRTAWGEQRSYGMELGSQVGDPDSIGEVAMAETAQEPTRADEGFFHSVTMASLVPVGPPHEHQWVLGHSGLTKVFPGGLDEAAEVALRCTWVCECGKAKVVEYEV